MHHLNRYWKVYTCGLLIMILSCLPADNKGTAWIDFPHADKILHCLFYSIFSMLILWSLTGPSGKHTFVLKNIVVSFVLVFSYGSAIEIVQHFFVPTRTGDPVDIIFNILGWVIAVVISWLRIILVS